MPEENASVEQPKVEDILKRQTLALESIQSHLIPEEVEERERKWRVFITKVIAFGSLMGGLVLGTWEFVNFMYKKYQLDQMVNRYSEVAEEVYYQENNAEVAKAFLGKALELDAEDPKLRYLESYIDGMAVMRNLLNLDRPYTEEELNQAHMAIAQAEMLERLTGGSKPEPHILKGQIYAALGDHERAYERLKQAVSIAPDNDFVYVRLASLASQQGNQEKALDHLDKALELNPESKWAWLWTGIILGEGQGKWDEAREAYEEALAIDPRFDMGYYNLAWTYLKQRPHDYDSARKSFEKTVAVNPGNKLAFYGLGMTYGYQNEYEIAKMYLDKAVDLDPMFLTGWKWRGIVYFEMGQYKEALADFSKALELDPSRSDLYVRRARVYQKQDKLNESIDDLHFASRKNPNDKRIWFYLGNVYLKVNEYSKARKYYDKAIAIDSCYSEAYAGRSDAAYGMGDQIRAMADMNKAVEVCSYRPERYFFRRGVLLERYSHHVEALNNFRKARETAPNYADAWYEEARLLKQTGDCKGALQAINEFIRLRPQDRTGYVLREDIQAM